MGGKILEYEAKTILNQGKEIGLSQGKRLKLIEIFHIVQNARNNFHLSAEDACDILGVDLAEYHEGEKLLREKE